MQTYRGDYAGATAYAIGDVVGFQGSSFVASTATTGVSPTVGATNATWKLLARGMAFGSVWSGAATYAIGQVVSYQGSSYYSITAANLNKNPITTLGTNWSKLASGLRPRGVWSSGTTYDMNDLVTYNGGSYVALQDAPAASAPEVNANYMLIAAKGDTGAAGAAGTNGSTGTAGLGVPAGGSTGQVLTKNTSGDNDTAWSTPTLLGWPFPWFAGPYIHSLPTTGASGSAAAGPSTTLVAYPIRIPHACTLSNFHYAANGAVGSLSAWLYNSDQYGPTTQLHSFGTNNLSTGLHTLPITLSFAGPTILWVAYLGQSSPSAMWHWAQSNIINNLSWTAPPTGPAAFTSARSFTGITTPGAVPNDISGTTYANFTGSLLATYFRVSSPSYPG